MIRGSLVAVALAACSSSGPPPGGKGRVAVVLTLDWEGAALDAENFAAVESLRASLGPVPLTHFVSAAYIAKRADAAKTIARAIRPGDQLAVHLHAWRSLARAAGLEVRLAPSFLTGTDQLLELPDGDTGFDTDLDTYDVPALRALLRTSRQLLEQTGVPVSHSFRAGGYLATPKMLLALGDEGYVVDSSAIDFHQLRASLEDDALPQRLAQVWPNVQATTQPFLVRGGAMQALCELPIAAVADYTPASEIVHIFDSAHAALGRAPTHDQVVVLAFHLETAPDYAATLRDVLAQIRRREDLAGELVFLTVDQAAELARFELR
jgi:hypothetical protein